MSECKKVRFDDVISVKILEIIPGERTLFVKNYNLAEICANKYNRDFLKVIVLNNSRKKINKLEQIKFRCEILDNLENKQNFS